MHSVCLVSPIMSRKPFSLENYNYYRARRDQERMRVDIPDLDYVRYTGRHRQPGGYMPDWRRDNAINIQVYKKRRTEWTKYRTLMLSKIRRNETINDNLLANFCSSVKKFVKAKNVLIQDSDVFPYNITLLNKFP